MPARKELEGIFYMLRTGCQPFSLETIWREGLEQYDELEGISWERPSVDGCMVKSPPALKHVGKNPTGQGKIGTKGSVLTDEKELPLAIVLSGANTHDIKFPEETLDHIVVPHPVPDEKHPKNLCLDAGYTGQRKSSETAQLYSAYSPSRQGEEGVGTHPGLPPTPLGW